jgi:hypothetical protein
MGHFDHGPHVFRRPGRLFLLRSVQVEFEEIRPVFELRRRRFQEGGAIIGFDQQAARDDATVADPRPRDADPRPSRVGSPPLSDAKGEGPPASIPGIHGERRPDIAGPPHTRAAQEVAVVLRDLEQFFGKIGPAIDPMRASGKREVAVTIDHPRDNRRASGVEDADVGR